MGRVVERHKTAKPAPAPEPVAEEEEIQTRRGKKVGRILPCGWCSDGNHLPSENSRGCRARQPGSPTTCNCTHLSHAA